MGENIVTMDPDAKNTQAVAVANGKIIAVGTQADILRHKSASSEIIELGSKALLPGFIDAHGHFTFQAMLLSAVNLSSPPVGQVTNIEDLKNTLKSHIAAMKIPKGQWIVGYGYDESLMSEGRHPTRTDLDAVSKDHPIYLLHVSGHLGSANSLALKAGDIGPDSADPEGGVIRRMADGKTPNGVLEERAQFAVQAKLPTPTPQQALAGLAAAQKLYARYGITTVQDGAASQPSIDLVRAANAQGLLSLDIVSYLYLQKPEQILPPAGEFGHYDGRFKLGGVKLVLDGSPQGKTAYLSHPYHVVPDGQKNDYRGYPNYPTDEVNAMVSKVLTHNVPLIAHANGDAMEEIFIDAVAASYSKGVKGKDRSVMIHAQTVREDQLDRMAQLAMIPSFFSSHVFFWGDYHRDSVLGPVRGARISPTKSALDRNMIFTTHNDSPVVPPDMIRLLWATSQRETRSGKILGAEQGIPIYDALKSVTVNAAYQNFEEDIKGSIAVGKNADFVILSENPLILQPADLLKLKVMQTISHGKTVFGPN
ncbi:amidohydrolase [Parasphingorhabdus sp.]|uniref:amidohydrolase n=1 Tax=Parasphingorhabdus sp. TaxID=2709688 RepID=UPI0035945209